MKHFNFILFIFLLIASCNQEPIRNQPSAKEIKEKLIEHNQKKVRTEDEILDSFVSENYSNAQKTETGLRYVIFPATNRSDLIPGKAQRVTIDYDIELLNGEVIYSTKKEGLPEKFRIEHEDAPAGLHEGLQIMHLGDSAVFIMPSYLAYGFTGDQLNIGQNAMLVYKVVLIEIE
jgi:peptidyl-prolyl cis-trans isomerase A (cyclophilin A)